MVPFLFNHFLSTVCKPALLGCTFGVGICLNEDPLYKSVQHKNIILTNTITFIALKVFSQIMGPKATGGMAIGAAWSLLGLSQHLFSSYPQFSTKPGNKEEVTKAMNERFEKIQQICSTRVIGCCVLWGVIAYAAEKTILFIRK